MIGLPGYRIVACIGEGPYALVFRGIRETDGAPVVVRVHRSEFPTFAELARFRNHHQITSRLDLPFVDRPLALESHGNGFALVSKDRGDVPLRERIRASAPSFPEVIAIGAALAGILDELHARNIIHKDIKPESVFIHPETGDVTLDDFSIATLLARESQEMQRPQAMEGTLAYIAPEQTGRLHRWIDHRSDLYSLGVMLYELLTGLLPFPATDPMELIHAHLARRPVPPAEVNPAVPTVVSDIVVKLLAKVPDERYQSAAGLRHDLEECLRRIREEGGIVGSFALGMRDVSDRFVVPDDLHGRSAEVARLMAAFDRVAQGGAEILLVSGSSGIGKSALVRKVHEPIVVRRGHFVAGKFDQFKRNVPFSSLVQAFRDLLRLVLTERVDRIEGHRARLRAALGVEGRVITEVIPEVELLIGKQPEVPALPPADNQDRFNRLFQQFIRVFADVEHPLVVFLDDLQWADSASLNLLVALLGEPETRSILLMGAFRDNEVDASHPLRRALASLERAGAKIEEISLPPLSAPDVNRLVAGALRCTPEEALELTEMVMKRTQGNPFFCHRYLLSLHQDGLIAFDPEAGRFRCDIDAVRATMASSDVVEFVLERMGRLPEATTAVLRLAAAMGSRFDLGTLALVHGKPRTATAADLWPALEEGLVLPLDEAYRAFQHMPSAEGAMAAMEEGTASYRFLHDRVQQAAYLLMSPADLPAVHLRIGRLLLRSTPADVLEEILFDVVGHLGSGLEGEGVGDPDERVEFARLHLAAGKKARDATAYAAAARYFSAGLAFLGDRAFVEQYELATALCTGQADVEYLEGNLERSETLVRRVIAEARTDLEKARAYHMLIVQYTLRALYPEAIEAGYEALALVGVDLPRADLAAARDAEMAEVERRLSGRDIASLKALPKMTSPEKMVAMSLLTTMGPPTYRSHQALWSVLCAKAVNLTLQYGNTPQVAYSHTSYGGLLGYVKDEYRRGAEFGEVALALADEFGSPSDRSVVYLMIGSSLRHWSAHLSRASDDYNQAYAIGLDSGNLQYAAYAFGHNMYCRFWQGTHLEQLLVEIAGYLVFSRRRANRWAIDLLEGGQLAIFALSGKTGGTLDFSIPGLDEPHYLARCRENRNTQVLCIYDVLKGEALHLLGHPQEARAALRRAGESIHQVATQGLLPSARYVFVSGLCAARLALGMKEGEERRALEAELDAAVRRTRVWMESCPDNFRHQHLLLSAELARLQGKDVEAIDLYDAAIEAAGAAGFPQDEALAAELAAMHWLARGKPRIAGRYLIEAYYGYVRWGAAAKQKQLERVHPLLLAPILGNRARDVRVERAIGADTSPSSLDLAAVLEATRAIFGEIVLGRLLQTLLRIARENAGAERGFLILPRGESLVIEARADAAGMVETPAGTPVDGCDALSEGIVRYVARTGETVVLDDATDAHAFSADRYWMTHRPRSLVCLPATNHGKLVAIMYLENDLTSGCFTPSRLELLRVLATQAAIAIENALLYADVQRAEEDARRVRERLEEEVVARTRELSEANVELARRAEELSRTSAQLMQELAQREEVERARAALQEEIIEGQRARLVELSTPLIPITDEIVVMPLIGTMDGPRAEQVFASALEGAQRGTRVVILDLTGMRDVDGGVVQTLLRTASALRLLGAETVLTGVRADVAHTLVELGVELGGIVTRGTLQSGIAHALRRARDRKNSFQ